MDSRTRQPAVGADSEARTATSANRGLLDELTSILSSDEVEGAVGVRHRAVLHELRVPCVVTDMRATIVDANPAAADLVGTTTWQELTGRTLPSVFVESSAALVRTAIRQPAVLEGSGGLQLKSRDGTVTPVTATVSRTRSGLAVWLVRPEPPSEDETAVERQPGVRYTCATDELWTCQAVSDDVLALTGFTADEWIGDGTHWVQQIVPDDRDRVLAERLSIGEGDRFSAEYRIRHADGSIIWIHDEAVVSDDRGHAHGLLVEVGRWRQSGEILKGMYERVRGDLLNLKRKEQERHVFLRLLAHDLRSAMGTSRGMVATLMERGRALDPERQDLLLQRSAAGLQRATEILDAVLEVDRLRCAGGGITVTRINLVELVESAVPWELIPAERVMLDVQDVDVEVDPFVVRRLLTNLVNNALEHTPAESAVRVRAMLTHEGLDLEVEDDGPGIPDRLKGEIFSPYVRLDDAGSGLGLGLALVRQLSEIHGGSVTVGDAPTGGAHFQVVLPGA